MGIKTFEPCKYSLIVIFLQKVSSFRYQQFENVMYLSAPHFNKTTQHILKRYLSVCIIMSPERSDLVLTADIPNCKTDVLVLNGLYIETNGGYRGHYFSEFQLV